LDTEVSIPHKWFRECIEKLVDFLDNVRIQKLMEKESHQMNASAKYGVSRKQIVRNKYLFMMALPGLLFFSFVFLFPGLDLACFIA
jgi:hypothetical protein